MGNENFVFEKLETPKGMRHIKKCMNCGKSQFISKTDFEVKRLEPEGVWERLF